MESEMRGIGEIARDSGLGVSALRFYDRAGVLVPAWVDPVSSYRWYAPGQLAEARLLARLRRAAMPLADIRLVLASWSGTDAGLVRKLLDGHLTRVERQLSDTRTEFSALRAELDQRENTMTSRRTLDAAQLSCSAPSLAAAFDAVRFAVSTDPELPVLRGILLDAEGENLHLVATDRYRLAVATTGAAGHGGAPRVQAVVPTQLADAMRALLDGEGTVRLSLDGDRVTLEAGDRQVAGGCVGRGFPDYRRLLPDPGTDTETSTETSTATGTGRRRVVVGTAALREALETGPVRTEEPDGHDLSVLKVRGDDTVTLCGDGDDDPDQVALNRRYLLDALTAGDRDRLTLEFGAPTAPVVIRRPGDDGAYSLLMPVRLDA
ncbi:MerR family transcriptional regulator [Streptomyces sp. NPDC090306]|uniref:DNA polymerase III subunit beta family protein n=1 Tax=Streptomyces sp. NPDC090306 TaxID=3365961 RepID=UPI00382DB3C9